LNLQLTLNRKYKAVYSNCFFLRGLPDANLPVTADQTKYKGSDGAIGMSECKETEISAFST